MSQTEVTQAQWKRVLRTSPWKEEDYPHVLTGKNYPAVCMSWQEAVRFCDTLTDNERKSGRLPEGWRFRLPTEVEWEYACRAGTTTTYFFGESSDELGEYAWYDVTAYDAGETYWHEVALKKANPWNLFDMYGNAWEWCQDIRYNREFNLSATPIAPVVEFRVVRGGGFESDAEIAQSCWSAKDLPSAPSARDGCNGVRIVLSQSDGPLALPPAMDQAMRRYNAARKK